MSEQKSSMSRRRLLAGAGAGAAAVWAAPAVTTLGGAAFAAGSCVRDQTLFEFITGNLTSPAKQPSANVAGPFVAGGTLALTSGQVDLVGAGTDFTAAQFPTETSIDLTGTYPAGTAGPVVSVLTAQGLALPAGAYIVELEYYGSVPGENLGNRIVVEIGSTTIIDTGTVLAVGGQYSASGSLGSANGALTLTHTSLSSDNRGLFLKRLAVYSATCQ